MKYYSFNAVWWKYICVSKCCAVLCLVMSDSATPWTVTCQDPLSMGILQARSGLPCPPPRDLPKPGIKPRFPALQLDSLLSEPPKKPKNTGVGSLFLLQRSFPIQESNWGLLLCRWFFTSWATREAHGLASVQFSSVAQLCPTLCDPMNRSTPGLPVHHQLPEFTQTHVHWVSDAIQLSHPLSSPSPPAPNSSQHQSLFQWVNSSHEVAKVLEFQL